jgi:hypothetical protein
MQKTKVKPLVSEVKPPPESKISKNKPAGTSASEVLWVGHFFKGSAVGVIAWSRKSEPGYGFL